jgi:hypothetical protein
MLPRGMTEPKPTPENGCEGATLNIRISNFLKAARLMRLRAAPPSTTIDQDVVQPDIGNGQGDEQRELSSTHHVLGAVRGVEADRCLHTLVMGCHPRRRCDRRHCSTQGLDNAPRRNIPGAPVHDVEWS